MPPIDGAFKSYSESIVRIDQVEAEHPHRIPARRQFFAQSTILRNWKISDRMIFFISMTNFHRTTSKDTKVDKIDSISP